MSRPKIVYVAGPITPRNGRTLSMNLDNAEEAVTWLVNQGFAVHCPHLQWERIERGESCPDTSTLLLADLTLLECCDAICMLPGWKTSPGARIEKRIAELMNPPLKTMYWGSELLFEAGRAQRSKSAT